ncbi:F-box domain-containing protein [Forsythia ovata]|uniref:F-box domain-containing protein n=1 Tax=Forsythia ovata TaxID=205694 RepID=A0ABD1WQZ4_9LAMI
MVGMTTGIPNLTKPRVAMRVTLLATHQKLKHQSMGLGSANGIVKFVKYDEDVDAEKRATIVYLPPNKDGNGQTAVRRLHGWMEIELGKFYYDLRDNGPVEARLLGNNFKMKADKIVAGDTREFMRYDWKFGKSM